MSAVGDKYGKQFKIEGGGFSIYNTIFVFSSMLPQNCSMFSFVLL